MTNLLNEFQPPLVAKEDLISKRTLYKQDIYAHYLLYAILTSYVTFVGTMLFPLLCRVIDGGFLAKDEDAYQQNAQKLEGSF